MKGQQIHYSDAELTFLKSNKTLPRAESTKLFNSKFKRDLSCENIKALYTRKGWLTGRTGGFEKNNTPHNKGKKQSDYMSAEAIEKTKDTRFKKGSIPCTTKHIGHERVDTKDGYIYLNVGERSYVPKHRYLWEKENGIIPDGKVLKCIDGDKTNCNPDNWQMVDRSILPRLKRRRYEDADPKIKPSIMAVSILEDFL